MLLRYVLLILLAWVFAIFGLKQNCPRAILKNFDGLDCSKKDMTEVPQDLDFEIKALNLADNHIEELEADSFKHYSNLRYLDLSGNRIDKISPSALKSPLSDLEILDLSYNGVLKELPSLPEKLKELYLIKLRVLFKDKSTLRLTEQKSIRVLSLENNEFKIFPKLEGIGDALEELSVKKNLFSTFTVNDLAPLCKLKRLNVTTEGLFRKAEDYCPCILVRSWFQEFGIEVDNFACPKGIASQCNNNSLVRGRKQRDECLSIAANRKRWYIYLAVAVGVIFLIILVVILRRRCRKNRKLTTSGKCSDLSINESGLADDE